MMMQFSVCLGALLGLALSLGGCPANSQKAADAPPSPVSTHAVPPAPPAETTGGFDGAKAYAHVAEMVGYGPRVPGTPGIHRTQDYIKKQLEGFGCTVEEDNFSAPTPIGAVQMKNIVAKAAGTRNDVVLFLSHYDTKREPEGFVGANDSGSSTGVMLELARHVCARKNALTVWVGFLDGEESFGEWTDTDSLYGSRQMAASLALSGDLKRVKAVVLADLVGYRGLRFKRETNSTKWLVDLVWSTAKGLGYGETFVDEPTAAEDDHLPFVRRGVPAVDIIQLDDYPHWHELSDTLDKIDPKSLAITGHVLLEVLSKLEARSR